MSEDHSPLFSPGVEATLSSEVVPKYFHVKEAILARIVAGLWKPEMLLPSESALGKEFGVSRITIRRAISDLVHEGKLYTVQGKGTIVSTPKVPERFVQRAYGLYEDMRRQGIELRTTILRQDQIPAPSEVANRLKIKKDEPVNILTRLRSVGDEKLLISTTYIPVSICSDLYRVDLSQGSLFELLSTRYNLYIAQGLRSLEAVLAESYEARHLDIPLGSPLLLLDSIAYLSDGRIFEYSRTYHRGERARIEIEFYPRQNDL